MSQRDKPNVEWSLPIGPLNPKAQKKTVKGKPETIVHSMSKPSMVDALSQCLTDITDICSGREPMFAKKWPPLKIVRTPGKTNILRLRFYIESPSSITRLEKRAGFKRLRSQADYSE